MKKIPRVWLLASALVCMSFAGFAQTAAADTQHFAFTGFEQTYVVPDRVHSVHVVAVGGRGGVGSDDLIGGMTFHGGLAGFGDRIEGDLEVTPGQALFIEVGGNGQDGVGATGGTGATTAAARPSAKSSTEPAAAAAVTRTSGPARSSPSAAWARRTR